MNRSKPTMQSGHPSEASATERGLDGAWSLLETLDAYEVEELTPDQAAKLLRAGNTTRRSQPANR
jgi:hypothetical protein